VFVFVMLLNQYRNEEMVNIEKGLGIENSNDLTRSISMFVIAVYFFVFANANPMRCCPIS